MCTARVVAAFAAQLKDAVDLGTVREDLARVVQTALGIRSRLGLDQPTRMRLAAPLPAPSRSP
jgi:hypothetical protein